MLINMVKITPELIRKKAEHNEGEICTLEELSLHQEYVEKIEHLQHWCKNLQILLLQSNLISRIENLHKLKRLQYLNLAVNNIEKIENLDRCESLQKLDLTLNFIGDLQSINNLKNNIHLTDLYLTGNPCTEFTGYRNFVIATLRQITNLDNKEVLKSERIKAIQTLETNEKLIAVDQKNYVVFREEQRSRLAKINNDDIPDEVFWKQETENCPEVRVEMAKRQKRAQQNMPEEKDDKKEIKLFTKEGRALNINQAKLKFQVDFENEEEIVLTLEIYKYLDTALIDVDLQPTHVKITIKNKLFQLALPDEIITSKSTAQRSQITGFLVVRMPKLNFKGVKKSAVQTGDPQIEPTAVEKKNRREFLEIGTDRLTELCNLVEQGSVSRKDVEFVDDESVPPLE